MYKAPSPDRMNSPHHGGLQVPTLIVIHGSVSPCVPGGARAIGRVFQGSRVASAHYGIDPSEVIQYVGDHTVAYHCGYNQNSLGLEMCMYPKHNLDDWVADNLEKEAEHVPSRMTIKWLSKNHRAMLGKTARLTAELCLAYDIPPRFVSTSKLRVWDRNGKRAKDGGITTHNLMSKTFRKSTHWDPGVWPRLVFMRRVKYWYKKLK